MEEEYKMGEYIRSIYGYIYKYNELSESMFLSDKIFNFIYKHSFNKINLIEEGDYVNGQLITRVIPEDICGGESLENQHIFSNDVEIFEKDIKSIVTKEKFKNIEYIVEED